MEGPERESLRINFLLPSIGISGGVKSTFELANRLFARGHSVNVIYPRIPGWMTGPHHRPSMRIRRLRHRARGLVRGVGPRWFDLRANVMRVPKLAPRYIPPADVTVATKWENSFDLAALPEDRGSKVYFIRHYETWAGEPDDVDRSYLLPLHRITTSSWLKRLIEERFGVEVEGIFPNGVDTQVFFREREDFVPANPRRVGLPYRDIPWKGMDDAIAALLSAKRHYPGMRLVLFGDEPSSEHLFALADIGDFEHHPHPSPVELRQIYESLDVFLFPSHHEGFGNPPLEAMACGVACIATRVGAVPDYTDNGRTAVLVDPGDIEGMAVALLRLMEDDTERESLARRALARARLYSWESTAADLETYLLGLVGRCSAAG